MNAAALEVFTALLLLARAPAFIAPVATPRAPVATPRASVRVDSFREFRASELTLERFVGEVSVTEVTDWEYSGELANPLDPAQPARTKQDAAGASPLRLFLATRDDPGLRARGDDARARFRRGESITRTWLRHRVIAATRRRGDAGDEVTRVTR